MFFLNEFLFKTKFSQTNLTTNRTYPSLNEKRGFDAWKNNQTELRQGQQQQKSPLKETKPEPYFFLENRNESVRREPIYMFGKYTGASWVNKKYLSNSSFCLIFS